MTDDRRQEFVLLSDVLGASMQTIAINNEAYGDATEATVFGPFFVEDVPADRRSAATSRAAPPGEPCWVEGTVTRHRRQPVPGARIEVWEADEDGFYDVQYDDDRTGGRGSPAQPTRTAGTAFWAITPTPYPIPHDGPVGQMLAATGRSPMRASHLHFMVSAPGLPDAGDAHLRARRRAAGLRQRVRGEGLAGQGLRRAAGGDPTPDGRDLGGRAWSRVRFDIVLAPRLRSRVRAALAWASGRSARADVTQFLPQASAHADGSGRDTRPSRRSSRRRRWLISTLSQLPGRRTH